MDFIFLTQAPLFRGVSPGEAEAMLQCLGATRRVYPKGARIYSAGEPVQALGLVLSGSAQIESNDVWGNRSLLDRIGPGQVFAETYALLTGEPLMVSVVAAEETTVLFLNVSRLLQPCSAACAHHVRLIGNLLALTAQKNLILSRRILHTSPKTIRSRLLSYLSDQALRHGSATFAIPFDRQQLADYLGVDRSALSHELGKMRTEGLIAFQKNRFTLLIG